MNNKDGFSLISWDLRFGDKISGTFKKKEKEKRIVHFQYLFGSLSRIGLNMVWEGQLL